MAAKTKTYLEESTMYIEGYVATGDSFFLDGYQSEELEKKHQEALEYTKKAKLTGKHKETNDQVQEMINQIRSEGAEIVKEVQKGDTKAAKAKLFGPEYVGKATRLSKSDRKSVV